MKLDAAWLALPALTALFDCLKAAGGEARLVGGAVRDALAHLPNSGDYDLATTLPPTAVTAACQAAGFKVVPTGIAHGTVTVIIDKMPFQVTTLRQDVAAYGRHAEVAFTTDWQADAARRDFTINALYADQNGVIYDYFDGLADLAQQRVRFILEPQQRIREDVLRILRFFRFSARFGATSLDKAGLEACAALAPLLPTLSTERVQMELLKTLAVANPAPIWALMVETGILAALHLPLNNTTRLNQLIEHEQRLNTVPSPLRRLWAVMDESATAQQIATQLKLSSQHKQQLQTLCPLPPYPASTQDQAKLAYRLGHAAVADICIIYGQDPRFIAAHTLPLFPLQGRDLLKLGLSAGAKMGKVLQQTEAWWIESDFTPTADECLNYAEALWYTSP